MPRTFPLTLACLLVAGVAATAANAADHMWMGFQDDPALRWRDGRTATFNRIQQFNTSVVRTTVYWSRMAPKRPAHAANSFDHAYRFVSHHATCVAMLHFLIWPQVAPANARAGDANDSISRLDDFRVGHVLDPNVASAIHHSCAHNDLLPIQSGLTSVWDNPAITPILTMPCR